MRVIVAPPSRFKRKVTKRAFATDAKGYATTAFEARHQARIDPFFIGNVKRHRGLDQFAVIPLSLGFDLDAFFATRRKAVVFEIGCGWGELLADLKRRFPQNIGRTIGQDISNLVLEKNGALIDELLVGDSLIARFPKSDLIVSQWTGGYIRDPFFILKKIENALNPGGVALAHFDLQNSKSFEAVRRGDIYHSALGAGKKANFDNLFARLKRTRVIGRSRIKIVFPDPEIVSQSNRRKLPESIRKFAEDTQEHWLSDIWFSWGSWLRDMANDPLVLIQKPVR